MARNTDFDDINKQNEEEYYNNEMKHTEAHSKDKHNNNVHLKNNQDTEHETHMQRNDITEEFDPFSKKGTFRHLETNKSLVNALQIIEDNEQTLHNTQYNRSMSMQYGNDQYRSSNIQRSKSVVEGPQHDEQESKDSQNKQIPFASTNSNPKNNTSKFDKSEKRQIEHNDRSPVSRLLEPTCEGIRERIELLGELLTSEKLDSVPDVYDEMAHIITATERNERLQAGPDGKRLLELTTAARSNLNIDLNNLDIEIQRQFGLYSVEVTGDGACAFRATSISGMQQPDLYHSQLREEAVQQVRDCKSYYSTVLRPGDIVSHKELEDWMRTMEDPNTYGDEMANMAVADRLHIQLVIFRAGELLTVVNPRDGFVKRTAFLVNVGTHYKALVSWSELNLARQNSERLCK